MLSVTRFGKHASDGGTKRKSWLKNLRVLATQISNVLSPPPPSRLSNKRSFPSHTSTGAKTMSTITTKDGTEIYYKDWGKGPVVTFSHGWPLNADMWDGQMLFLVQKGYRCVALDRRGHGRSSQASDHNDMDGYADDLAAVIEALNLREATLVGHSTGGGEEIGRAHV